MTTMTYDSRYLRFQSHKVWLVEISERIPLSNPICLALATTLPRRGGRHSGSPVGGLFFRMGHLECWLMCSFVAGGHSLAGAGMVGRKT